MTKGEGLNIGKSFENEMIFKPLDYEFILKHKLLTPEKVEFAKLPQQFKVMIGAKNLGKTLVALLATLVEMEQQPLAHGLFGRKNKELAKTRLSQYFLRTIQLVKRYGYIPRYEFAAKYSRVYAVKDKQRNEENSFIDTFSLEDYIQTDGGAPTNLGYVATLLLDEPIIKTDMHNPDKIPSTEEWEGVLSHIRSNIDRFNGAYEEIFKLPNDSVKTTEWYTMNDWGAHPLSELSEKIFPQDEFIYAITKYHIEELLGNKKLITKLTTPKKGIDGKFLGIETSQWYKIWNKTSFLWKIGLDKNQKEIAVARGTFFANPTKTKNPKDVQEALLKLAQGFIFEKWHLLAEWCGLRYTPPPNSELLVYNIANFNKTILTELIGAGYLPEELSYGIDLDTSRVNTIVPAWLLLKEERILGEKETRKKRIIFIDKMIQLSAAGSGDMGEMHALYSQSIVDAIHQHFKKNLKIFEVDEYLEKTYLVVDDNRNHYLNFISKKMPHGIIENWTSAVKHGHYDIIERQDYFETSFNEGIMHMHKENQVLMNDFNMCVKVSTNAQKRVETGNQNILDGINAAEYAAYWFCSTMIQSGKAFNYKAARQLELAEQEGAL